MADENEGALGRWSRRKQSAARVREEKQLAPPTPARPAPSDIAATSEGGEPQAVSPEDLPELSSLNGQSDFAQFLRAGVPEDLRREALRILWRSDPVLANLDGLNDYDDDMSAVGTLRKLVATAYRVGQGYAAPTPEDPGDHDAAEGEEHTVDAASAASEPEDPNRIGHHETPQAPAQPAAPGAASDVGDLNADGTPETRDRQTSSVATNRQGTRSATASTDERRD
jgi:hypothetical protein